jgi:hypothetical protein
MPKKRRMPEEPAEVEEWDPAELKEWNDAWDAVGQWVQDGSFDEADLADRLGLDDLAAQIREGGDSEQPG